MAISLSGGRSVAVERNASSIDEVVLRRGTKVLSRFALPRESADPRVLGLRVVREGKDAFLVDYFRGSSGTKVIHESNEAWLFAAQGDGLKELDHIVYRSESVSREGITSSSRKYAVVKKGGTLRLETK